MDNELDSAVKILKKKLFLLNPSLTRTPKQEGPPVCAYGTEASHSPVQDVRFSRNEYKFSGPPVEITINSAYAEATILSLKKEKKTQS